MWEHNYLSMFRGYRDLIQKDTLSALYFDIYKKWLIFSVD